MEHNEQAPSGASDQSRTDTKMTLLWILSPVCLPFHHTSKWLREWDLNPRPQDYETCELPNCSISLCKYTPWLLYAGLAVLFYPAFTLLVSSTRVCFILSDWELPSLSRSHLPLGYMMVYFGQRSKA